MILFISIFSEQPGIRLEKLMLELNLLRDIEDNKKSFYTYVTDKRKMRGNVSTLWKETGNLVTWDME